MSDDKPRIVKLPLVPSFEERVDRLTGVAPDPNGDAFAVSEAERQGHPINERQWRRVGAWSFREFGEEAQLRNAALPWLSMDLYRSEVEELHRALSIVLERPMVVPFRLSRWDRFKQWWLRAVWRRRHYAELKAARETFVEQYTRAGPWGTR